MLLITTSNHYYPTPYAVGGLMRRGGGGRGTYRQSTVGTERPLLQRGLLADVILNHPYVNKYAERNAACFRIFSGGAISVESFPSSAEDRIYVG